MKLGKLFEEVNFIRLTDQQKEIDIKEIKIDANSVEEGDLCLFLKTKMAENYRSMVFNRGAKMLIEQDDRDRVLTDKQILCSRTRELFALLSKKLNDDACEKLKIIGITGTNGKSTTTKMIYDILNSAGHKTGLIGTMGIDYNGKHFEPTLTTPDPDELHKTFANMVKEGCEYAVMEVSAHAIALNKLEGITFDVLALTNITQDHLDFFGTMDKYATTKLAFFSPQKVKQAVVCADDPYGKNLLKVIQLPSISYGTNNPCDVFAIDIFPSFYGTKFTCNCLDEVFIAETQLVGDYNVLNVLCATAICNLCGVNVQDIKFGLIDSEPVSGRFNVIDANGVDVVIDYAHTPDGLVNLLQTARELSKRDVVCLFGCGGNRDKSKRKLMGGIAELYADKVIITSDNPRLEKPMDIIIDIEKGFVGNNYIIEEDRKKAIRKALSSCQKSDCLVIAGKGGESYQDINGEKIPYNDFDEVYTCIEEGVKYVEENRIKYVD